MSRIPSASALCVEPAHADELHHGDLRDAELGADILQAELNTLSRALEELAALQKFPDEPTMVSAYSSRALSLVLHIGEVHAN